MVKEQINELRKRMRELDLEAYIIPSADPHQSEYVAEHYQSRAWISGFTGSAGTVVVTQQESGLWTDGRYFIQAEKELKDSGIKLYKMGQPGVPKIDDWLNKTLKKGQKVGVDGKCFSIKQIDQYKEKFKDTDIEVVGEYDLITELWKNRPELPNTPVIVHEVKYAGETTKDKIKRVREKMSENNADYYILAALDDIAWLFNIRGNDVKHNPVTMAYALITKEHAYLYIDDEKISDKVKHHLENELVTIRNYEDIDKDVSSLDENKIVCMDSAKINYAIGSAMPQKIVTKDIKDIVENLKAIKNAKEIENLKACHDRDNIAMVKFLYWLDTNVGGKTLTEIKASDHLEMLRRQLPLCQDLSFTTISAYEDHGAMMHYSAKEETQHKLEPKGFLLVDSGGQYLDGTTDITRTIVLGDITAQAKKDFTLVLKGHIGLNRAVFLKGVTGSNLDILARQHLWSQGIDYKCGTGHGVGFYLSVHEGPQRIAHQWNSYVLKEGMIITNEPGCYREGEYGIRIENTVLVVKDQETEFGEFLKFDVISYCPIDRRAINVDMLSEDEKNWINDYHKTTYDKLHEHLTSEEDQWLKNMTKPL